MTIDYGSDAFSFPVAIGDGLRRRVGMMGGGRVQDGDPQVIACRYGGCHDAVASAAGALAFRPEER